MKTPSEIEASTHSRHDRRVWDALGHATSWHASEGFAGRVLAAATAIPQDRPISPVIRWMRFAGPLAAAAALVLAVGSDMYMPRHETTRDLDRLARLEAALTLLPDAATATDDLDPNLLDIASLDDPSNLTNDQLFALMY